MSAKVLNPLSSDLGGEHRAEPVPPKPHRLVANIYTALVQQILDVPQRQREPDVHHYRQADDLGGRLEVAKRGAFCHGRTLNSRPARLKPVSSDRALQRLGANWETVAEHF